MKENDMNLDLDKFDKLLDEALKERPAPMDETALTGVTVSYTHLLTDSVIIPLDHGIPGHG